MAGSCAAEQVLVEDHLHPPDLDHQLLGRESGDLLLKLGMTSSDPFGNSTLSLIDPLVVEGGLVGVEEHDDGVEHDLDLDLEGHGDEEEHDGEMEHDDEVEHDLDQVGRLQT